MYVYLVVRHRLHRILRQAGEVDPPLALVLLATADVAKVVFGVMT